MAKAKKVQPIPVRHKRNAPCAQEFNVSAKPGKKTKTWWNGYRKSAPRPEAD